MTVYTEIGQIPDGQELAIQFTEGPYVQKWRFTEGQFVGPEGQHLAPWFFSGLLAQGKVVHGDFAPAQPKEWFRYIHDQRTWYLVLRVEDNMLAVGHFTVNYDGRPGYNGFATMRPAEILRQFRRHPMPEWASDLLVNMTIYAREQEREVHQQRVRTRAQRDAVQHMRYARDYANSALEAFERGERRTS